MNILAKLSIPVLLLIPACQAPMGADAVAGDTAVAASRPSKEHAKKATDIGKEFAKKERELAHALADQKIQAIARESAKIASDGALRSADHELDAAEAALRWFRKEQKPRELEEHKIRLDRRTHSADHAKDELGELEAMYQADEFAKTTKELVLKRGRRQLEIATRELEVAKGALKEFTDHTLPRRERELQTKIEKARLAREKAQLGREKLVLEQELAKTKEMEKVDDLRKEIAKLKKDLAKVAK